MLQFQLQSPFSSWSLNRILKLSHNNKFAISMWFFQFSDFSSSVTSPVQWLLQFRFLFFSSSVTSPVQISVLLQFSDFSSSNFYSAPPRNIDSNTHVTVYIIHFPEGGLPRESYPSWLVKGPVKCVRLFSSTSDRENLTPLHNPLYLGLVLTLTRTLILKKNPRRSSYKISLDSRPSHEKGFPFKA